MKQKTDPLSTRRIWTFGSLRLQEGSKPPTSLSGKTLSLLAYLLIHADTLTPREVVADALWPDSDPAQSRRQLSDTLYRLRQSIGDSWLHADRERLGLHMDQSLWVDFWAFEELTQQPDPAAWERATSLYKGDFLPELYEEWVLPMQVRLRELHLTCLDKLAHDAEENGRFNTARTYYQQLIHLDPLYEKGYRGLMRCLAALSRSAEALDLYDKLVDFLAQEMDIEPAATSRHLAEQIRHDWQQKSRSSNQRVQQAPFIGRAVERSQLLTHLDEARQGNGGLVVVLGEAGMGKTRLLHELAGAAEWRGWHILWGSGEEFALPATYAPLSQALTAVPHPRWQQLQQLIEPFWLSLLANLVPGLSHSLNLATPSGLDDTHQQLPQAISRILLGLQDIAPHLILLDDVQWGDPGIWALLDALHPNLKEANLMIVVSGRRESLRNDDAAWSKLEAWDRHGMPIIHLEGLSTTALAELAAAQNTAVSAEQLTQLHQASGGNPLFVQTLLATEGEWQNLAQRPSLNQLIQQRFDKLNPGQQLVLQAASVIGYQFDYATWTAVLGDMPNPLLPTLAGELEQEGLLVIEKESYRFAHDTLRACIYNNMDANRQEALHRQILSILTSQQPPNALSCLQHAQRINDPIAIAQFAIQAGQEAATAFNLQAALGYFEQAVAALGQPDDSTHEMWYQAINGRIQTAITLARHDEVEAAAEQLLAWSQQQGTAIHQAQAYLHCANIAWMTGKQAIAQQQAETGLHLIRQSATVDEEIEARLLETLARIARHQGNVHLCQQWVTESLTHYQAAGNLLGQASALDKLANLQFQMGDYEQAATQHRQAADQFHQLGATLYEGRSLNGLALALRSLGQYDEAQAIHEQCLAIARQFQDRYGAWSHLVNLGNIAFELGDFETAVSHYQQALTIPQELQAPRGISMTLNNLGQARRGQGRFADSLTSFAEALAINREHGFRSGEGHSLNGQGLALWEADRHEEATAVLTEAITIWHELDDRLRLLDALASLALAQTSLNQVAAAQRTIDEALAIIQSHDADPTRRLVYYAAYVVYVAAGNSEKAISYLQQAEKSRRETAVLLTPAQQAYYDQIALNQQIKTAVATLSQQETVSLVGAEVPLGRKLTPDDYVPVTWTLYQPQDDDFPPHTTDRRRHVLLRLVKQAQAQGAVATDSDLAQALGVSRRTILRDVQALTEAGHPLPTRRRQ